MPKQISIAVSLVLELIDTSILISQEPVQFRTSFQNPTFSGSQEVNISSLLNMATDMHLNKACVSMA